MSYFGNTPGNQLFDIAVLAGGTSAECEVSLESGRCVADALQMFGHQVAVFDPADVDLFGINWREFDACFLALHGGAGEDGRIQLQLEELAVPYTGSGPVASRLAMSKAATKERLRQCRIPTPPSTNLHASEKIGLLAARLGRLGYPLVLKPDAQGCSLGVSVAWSIADVTKGLEGARQFGSFFVAERLIRGRELTVAVIDGEPLPALEITTQRPLFDFECKFGPNTPKYSFPEGPEVRSAVDMAVAATDAVGTRGLVRVDMMLDDHGDAWVLELNTIPGMTKRSLVPLIAEHAGTSLVQLCDRLVRQCVAEDVPV